MEHESNKSPNQIWQISDRMLKIEKDGWDLFHKFVKIERMKNIEIIPIARKKLERRGISEEWIMETINGPDQMVDGCGEVMRYWKEGKDED